MAVAIESGKKKMNYARNRKCRSRWEPRGIVPASWSFRFPAAFLIPAFALFSLSLSSCATRGRGKRSAKSALVIYRVCTRSLTTPFSDGLPISRTSIAVRNWSGNRAFILSPTNEMLSCWITSNPTLECSINLDVDGFDGSFCVSFYV